MCGTEYCGTCEAHAREHGVEDWAQGLRHDTPEFGDRAQKRVASNRRAKLFSTLRLENSVRAREFPELVSVMDLQGDVGRLISRLQSRFYKTFDRLLKLVPELAAYAAEHPYVVDINHHGKCHRKARVKAHKLWQCSIIRAYVRSLGVEQMVALYQSLDFKAPAWLLPSEQAEPATQGIAEWLGIDLSPSTPERILIPAYAAE